ncbi:MAG: dihydroneopterin aldolase [Flavobacteriales bacterium]|nr:dihydroneopterin aldolase [Flavobacteriales bacterium]MDG1780845.1 dihydroneopterin aldolase [Flavobacteriales bacterium]MDG2246730.1 dihydroneopterin aldolase [Flavobacteriales bacterium]
MGIIRVTGIRVQSNHGCMEEEMLIGQEFIVNIELTTDLGPSMVSDDLKDTVDYVAVHDIVFRETKQRSKLIEHVAHRIGTALKKELPQIEQVKIEVVKPAPPIGGDVASVAVEIVL